MGVLYANNATTLLASAIDVGDTTLTVTTGAGSLFPSPTGGDYFYATLQATDNSLEIVRVTARSGDNFTVTRAQEGTTAKTFSVGSRVELRVTAASVRDLVAEHDEADEITIADAGGYFASGTVEGALQEIGAAGGSFGVSTFVDTFTGDGLSQVFTLSHIPLAGNLMDIYIDGVYQQKSTYSFVGTTLTFSEAPPLNASIEAVINANITAGAISASNVSYSPAGSGAVNTTVETKLREFVSVKDFGAVGDGVTDDTAAFNAAWAATDPQAVYVPAASYAITGTVTGKFFSFGVATVVGGTVTTITNLVP